MRAAKFSGEERIEIVQAAEPCPGLGEVTVNVAACALSIALSDISSVEAWA